MSTQRGLFRGMARAIRANMLVGLFLTIPIVATILIFNFLLRLGTNWLPEGAFPGMRDIWGGYLLRALTLLIACWFQVASSATATCRCVPGSLAYPRNVESDPQSRHSKGDPFPSRTPCGPFARRR